MPFYPKDNIRTDKCTPGKKHKSQIVPPSNRMSGCSHNCCYKDDGYTGAKQNHGQNHFDITYASVKPFQFIPPDKESDA